MMMSLFIVKISLISLSSRLCFLHKVSMMPIRSLVGMLVYMFEISNDAKFNSGTKCMCDRSFISGSSSGRFIYWAAEDTILKCL